MPEIYTDNESIRHSDEVKEIITRVPSWILRWGLMVFFIALVGVVGFSALIEYPDIIKTTLKIKTSRPDKRVVCDAAGDIIKLLANSGDEVKQGQTLAYIRFNDSTIHNLVSPIDGKLFYNGIVRQGAAVTKNSEIFYVEPNSRDLYGEMAIPQNSITKIHKGQAVLIKLKNYSFEQYGMLHGIIKYTSTRDGTDTFIAEVEIKNTVSDKNYPIQLKPGMDADAEIVIQSSSVLHKMMKGFLK
jgi:multidrug resistance efflux pump